MHLNLTIDTHIDSTSSHDIHAQLILYTRRHPASARVEFNTGASLHDYATALPIDAN
jgi:hypothetical protein